MKKPKNYRFTHPDPDKNAVLRGPGTTKSMAEQTENTAIRTDLRRVLINMAITFALLAGFYLANQKLGLLAKFQGLLGL